ncbi:MAG: hypothetical protein H6685_12340, partial [Deltaproteobacteria bacterium]|nr:hypothetical protein [Deltaproteobacteria bacterium]
MSNVTRWVNRAFVSAALALAVFVVGFAASATKVAARPELAGYNNRQCWECHVNPMGGGMRNAKGNEVARELSLTVTKEAIKDKYPIVDDFEPELSEHFAIGGDMRLLWYDQQVDEDMKAQVEAAGGEVDQGGTFYEMQAVFHLLAKPLPMLSFVYSPDVAQDTFEAYGLIHDLPLNSYIKAGRFILP